jgi:hypothetical protein
MSLLEYEKTFPWAVAIKNQVLALTMPPWFVDETSGVLRHSPSLTAREIDTVVDWCVGGTPEGALDSSGGEAEPVREERPSAVVEKALSGEPDLVLAMEEPFLFEADATAGSHEAVLRTGLRGDRYLRAIEFRPEHANIARSALFYVVPEGAEPRAPFASWVAGEGPEMWEEGRGVRLPANAALRVRIHYPSKAACAGR